MTYRILPIVLSALLLSSAATAQTQTMVLGGGKIQLGADQKLIFEADKHVMSHDYKGAEALYTQAIAANNSNVSAYLQRGIVRRELSDANGAASDGNAAVTLANTALQANPNSADSYYQRGMGLRLMRNFTGARQDIQHAMQMNGGQPGWDTDLKAIDFEEKAVQ